MNLSYFRKNKNLRFLGMILAAAIPVFGMVPLSERIDLNLEPEETGRIPQNEFSGRGQKERDPKIPQRHSSCRRSQRNY